MRRSSEPSRSYGEERGREAAAELEAERGVASAKVSDDSPEAPRMGHVCTVCVASGQSGLSPTALTSYCSQVAARRASSVV